MKDLEGVECQLIKEKTAPCSARRERLAFSPLPPHHPNTMDQLTLEEGRVRGGSKAAPSF